MNRFNLNIKTDGNRQRITLPPYLQDKLRGNCLINVDNVKLDLDIDYDDYIIGIYSSIFQPNSFDNSINTNSNVLCYLENQTLLTPSHKIFVNSFPNEFDIYLEIVGDRDDPVLNDNIPRTLPNQADRHLSMILSIEVLEDTHNCGCE